MRKAIGFLLLTACVLATSTSAAFADDNGTRRPSMFSYGWSGLTTGLAVGVAAGYLATGPTYQSGEWKMVVTGLGVGALSGLGTGIILGIVDIGSAPDTPGYIVLRDIGFGSGLGAITGLIVGAIVAVNGGELRDLSRGTAYGTLIGAGTGMLFGILEAALTGSSDDDADDYASADRTPASRARIRFTVSATQDANQHVVWMPAAYGTF